MRLLYRKFESLINYKAQGKYCTAPTYLYPSKSDEYSAVPEYPPIEKDQLHPEKIIKKKWFDKIKRQMTVEEKLFEVNVQRRYGWRCFMIHEGIVPLNNLIFAQHMTKTHLIETEKLPELYDKFSEKSEILSNDLKNEVIDSIEYQLDIRRHRLAEIQEPIDQEKEITRLLITELNRVLLNNLWEKEPYLKTLQIDYSPRIEASWKIESLVETFVRKAEDFERPLEEIPEERLDRPSDKYIQYIGHPILQLRTSQLLPQIIPMSDANVLGYSVPVYNYDPHVTLGYELNRRHLNNIPGFWPGDDREFSFMSYHSTNHIKYRPPTFGAEDARETLLSQAIFASFGWLMPVACYQGFSSYHDVTYPMVTQTVLTDGREFTFAVYQLNTTELHWENPMENLKCNICWITPSKSLYDCIENGKIKGFNEDALKTLVQFYINEPKVLENVCLKPYLGDQIKHVADYADDEKVAWLEEKFKKSCNNYFARHPHLYNVKDWERIYKIQFTSRLFDARRRPFELNQNPYHEKLSDNMYEYIPKKLRPDKHLPKWRQRKYRRTFFPE